jgi:hypothetical protein
MTKETLVAQLEAAKALSSQVDIDKVIELINGLDLTKTPLFTQELVDDLCCRIELCLDNNSDDLVDKDNVEFSIGYGNVIEVDSAQIDTYETMRHITAVVEEFVDEEQEDEEVETMIGGVGVLNSNEVRQLSEEEIIAFSEGRK